MGGFIKDAFGGPVGRTTKKISEGIGETAVKVQAARAENLKNEKIAADAKIDEERMSSGQRQLRASTLLTSGKGLEDDEDETLIARRTLLGS